MASVNSPIRKLLKPILFKLLGKKGYIYLQYLAKVKDINNRLVEEKEMVLLPKLVKRGDDVLDLGANYAYYTIRLSELVGDSGKVYAFEPVPFTNKVCEKVIKHFKSKNVNLFKKGVGANNETIEFNVPIVDFGAISAGQAHFGSRNNDLEGKQEFYQFDKHEKVACEVVNLDDFLGSQLKNLSFIKIDIEGAEFFALKGMMGILKKFKPVILIEIQPFFLKGFDITIDELFDLLQKELGYKIYYFNEKDLMLHLLKTEPWDNNYILIHSSKVENFKTLLAHEK